MLLPYHRPYTGQTGEQTGPFQDSMVTVALVIQILFNLDAVLVLP